MKSALELAMEKAGKMGAEAKPLSENQKKMIAEERKKAEAKIAEAKIMLDEKIAKAGPNAALAPQIEKARQDFLGEKAKIERDLERKVEKIREG